MAEPEQEAELLDGTVSHSLSDDTGIVDTTHEQTDHDGMSEELLSQALADANAFDTSTITYAVSNEESEMCDTVQDHACVSEGLSVGHGGPGAHISTNGNTILVHSSGSILTNTSDAIFSNGTDSLLTNGTSEVLGVERNGTFTVDVGSLPEGHIISIPSDIMHGSVIVSQSNEDQYQQSVSEMNDETQLLQDGTHQIVRHIEPHYIQSNDTHILQSDSDSQLIQSDAFTQPRTITVSAAGGMTLTPEVLQSVIQQIQAQQLAQQQAALSAAEQRKQTPATVATTAPNTVSFTLVSPSQNNLNSPPLGSSQNPIRIIQQGNRYTPMQQLTSEQLQQIMQVVQQQQVNKNTQENGGAVIFNPQTNTRIMYRVIYPSELHKTQNGAGHTTYQVVRPSTSSQEQQTGTPHQKRPYKRRKDAAIVSGGTGEEEDKEKSAADAPELSKEEKEERKKHRPRTRSGRVSKPPKHMVQDYKRIHVLDWDEDYDDSDGGYSDFKHSDEESKVKQEGEEEHSTSPEFFQALGAGRPKNHKCQTCDKSYIGQAGLARHYRLNPDHCINPTENGSISSLNNGSIDGDDSKDASLLPDGSSSRMSDSAVDIIKSNCNASSIDNVSEDSNTQDSLNSTGATSPVVRRGRGRGGFRGRWAHLKHNAQIRRKNKLKELIKQCADEDLMEVVLPRLVSSVSLWEYLMMKSENGGARPQVDVIYREFEALRHHVRQACADYMQPLTWEELQDDSLQCKMIKVSDKNLALCLDLEPVTYRVKEMPPGDSSAFTSLHNRLSSAIFAPSLDTAALSVTKSTSLKKELAELLPDTSAKRHADSDHLEESATKKARTSDISSPLTHIQTSSSVPVSLASLYTVTANLTQSTDSKVSVTCCESTVSSPSSLPSLLITSQSSQARGQSSTVSSSLSSPVCQSGILSSKFNSTSANVRSPYIHISCPTTKQQPVSYTLAGPKKLSPASSRASKSQPVPVVITQPAAVAGSKTQPLPYIMGNTSGSLAGLQQRVLVAASESQTLQAGTVPVVFTASGIPQPGSATVLLTSGSANSEHRLLARQQPPTLQGSTHVVLTNQSLPSKSQKVGSSTPSFFPSATMTTVQSPTLSTNSRSLLGIIKPTEVRVSRQLFHETTSPPTSFTTLTNGRSPLKTAVTSLELPPVLQQFQVISTMVSSSSHPITAIGSGIVSHNQHMSVKSGSNKTLVTPPSGQQFAASPNKMVISSQVGGVDDMSVLAGMELSGDDLGVLNTSSDSLNGSLSGCSHLTDSVMTADMAATSSVSQSADDTTSLMDIVQIVNTDIQAFDSISKGCLNGSHGIPLVNGSSSSYIKAKDNNIISQSSSLSSPSSSSPLTLAETTDFLHISSKPPKLISPVSQDSSGIVQPNTYHMTTNGHLSNHSFKSDISSSLMIPDISSLQFTDHGSVHIVDGGHLSDISPILTSEELQENTINILSEQVSCSEAQEMDGQSVDLGEVAVTDSLVGEEDGQLLLSEGTNIYQTEDGTFIIQRANGNTYQLQGAQGLPLETVQALLSGTLDQLVAVDASSDGSQTDGHLH